MAEELTPQQRREAYWAQEPERVVAYNDPDTGMLTVEARAAPIEPKEFPWRYVLYAIGAAAVLYLIADRWHSSR